MGGADPHRCRRPRPRHGTAHPTAAYLICVSVAGPALVELGLPELYAHLFVFWYALLCTITPPVCGNVFIAAGIAPRALVRDRPALDVGGARTVHRADWPSSPNPSLLQLADAPALAILALVKILAGLTLISAGVVGTVRGWPLRIAALAGGFGVIFAFGCVIGPASPLHAHTAQTDGSGRALQIVVWPIIFFPVSRYPPDGMMRQHGSAARVPESRAAIPRQRGTEYALRRGAALRRGKPLALASGDGRPAAGGIRDRGIPVLRILRIFDRFDWFDDVDAAHVAFRDDRFNGRLHP